MCLESINLLLELPFAWLGLALFAALIAGLAYLSLFASAKKDAAHRSDPGFTCPCHVPPEIPKENDP